LMMAAAMTTARRKEVLDIDEKDGSVDKYFIPSGRR